MDHKSIAWDLLDKLIATPELKLELTEGQYDIAAYELETRLRELDEAGRLGGE